MTQRAKTDVWKNRAKKYAFAGLALMSVLGCGQRSPEKLSVGYVPIAVALPLFVAADEGYFKDQGFDVEMVRFASSNEVASAATSGQVDIFVAATNVVLDVGHVSHKRARLLIPNPYTNQEGHITDYILVRDTARIKTLHDLRGKRIGIFPGSVIKVFCNLILEKYGLSKDDYQLVELAPKDWAAALQSGQVDALSALEPQASQIVHDGIGYAIASGFYASLMPNVPLSAHWISEDFATAQGKAQTERVVAAIDRAVDFIDTHPQEAKQYLVKYANVRQDVLPLVELNPWPKHAAVNATELQAFIDLLYEQGAVQSKEDINAYLLR